MAGLYKLVLHSHADTDTANEFVNVFGYNGSLIVVNEMQELANAFVAQVLPDIANTLYLGMHFTRLEVYNVTDGVGYLDKSISPSVDGVRTGEALPAFLAWGFKYVRQNTGERSGFKRFGYLVEGDMYGNNPDVGVVDELTACAAALKAPLTVGPVQTWFPVILEKKAVGVYPWTFHSPLDVVFHKVTSQNSRKK